MSGGLWSAAGRARRGGLVRAVSDEADQMGAPPPALAGAARLAKERRLEDVDRRMGRPFDLPQVDIPVAVAVAALDLQPPEARIDRRAQRWRGLRRAAGEHQGVPSHAFVMVGDPELRRSFLPGRRSLARVVLVEPMGAPDLLGLVLAVASAERDMDHLRGHGRRIRRTAAVCRSAMAWPSLVAGRERLVKAGNGESIQ